MASNSDDMKRLQTNEHLTPHIAKKEQAETNTKPITLIGDVPSSAQELLQLYENFQLHDSINTSRYVKVFIDGDYTYKTCRPLTVMLTMASTNSSAATIAYSMLDLPDIETDYHDDICSPLALVMDILRTKAPIEKQVGVSCKIYFDIIKKLILRHKVDVNCIYHGYSPLHIAAEIGHTALMTLLLDNGAVLEECVIYPLHFKMRTTENVGFENYL